MKRFLFSLALLASVGCAQNPHILGFVIVPVNGVQLEIFNHCSQTPARVSPSVGESWIVPPGGPTYVFIPFIGGAAKATYMNLGGRTGQTLMGSVSRSFDHYTQTRGRTVQWIIGGNSTGGGEDIVIDHIYDTSGRIIC